MKIGEWLSVLPKGWLGFFDWVEIMRWRNYDKGYTELYKPYQECQFYSYKEFTDIVDFSKKLYKAEICVSSPYSYDSGDKLVLYVSDSYFDEIYPIFYRHRYGEKYEIETWDNTERKCKNVYK